MSRWIKGSWRSQESQNGFGGYCRSGCLGQAERNLLCIVFQGVGEKTDLGNARMHLSRSLYVIAHKGRIPARFAGIENTSRRVLEDLVNIQHLKRPGRERTEPGIARDHHRCNVLGRVDKSGLSKQRPGWRDGYLA